jgi:ABC-type sugar transport system ATPase subunit
MALADRIAVMYRGRLVAVLPAAEVTKEQLGLLMAGATLDGGRRTDDGGQPISTP